MEQEHTKKITNMYYYIPFDFLHKNAKEKDVRPTENDLHVLMICTMYM